jgi:integrase
MRKLLTARFVENAKPEAKRREIADTLLRGLYFIVQPSGSKSWAIRYRLHRKAQPKLTLGPYPLLDVAKARDLAKKKLLLVSKGVNPAHRADGLNGRDLVKNVVAEFIKRHAKQNRSWPEVERMFTHDVLPVWSERQIQTITRRDVRDLMDALVDRGVGPMTNRVFSVVRKFFNWARERDIVDANPCDGLRPPVLETSRDRVLSDSEIRLFWKSTDTLAYPFGSLFQLLLLTGARLSEVGEMTFPEIDFERRMWTIPKERTKNGVAHEIPLSNKAVEVIESLPRIQSKAGYLFTTTGETSVSGWSRAKRNLDKMMAAAGEDVTIPPWRLHDARRTAASGMARLGIALPIIEKILNHTSGSFSGIVGVYQRHDYRDEKRRALEAWASFVEQLVADKPLSNIVQLAEARQ